MYLKKSKRKDGRIYMSIADGFYDKVKKHTRTITIQSLGYLDKLESEFDDPIAHFSAVVKKMNEEKNIKNSPIILKLDSKKKIHINTSSRKNFGYAALSKIYHELEIDKFFINRQRTQNFEYDTNAIMKLLVYSRILNPSSKKKTYENKDIYFDKLDFSLDDVYRSLSHINKHKEALQLWMHNHIKEQYDRNTDVVYYDVTNYYFEIDQPDDFRKKGLSKEHRPNPIVQMGLLMDTKGIPISYKLFNGNTVDKLTLRPMLKEVIVNNDYDLGRIIVVADKGLNTGDNLNYTLSGNNGYVISQTVRGGTRVFKDYVLDESGYTWIGDKYKIKSRLYPKEISVTSVTGKKTKRTVDEKQVIFYSEDYDKRAKADRAKTIEKSKDLANNPGKYNKATSYGAAKYIKNIEFDKKTGEILSLSSLLTIDEEKLRKEEALDGYYAIVTSEMDKTDEEIIEIYRGLWKIEESFKVTKSDLKTRPVYLSNKEHIEAHFLTCFIALAITRILQHRLDNKYSITKIIENLNKAFCTHITENIYCFEEYTTILKDIGRLLEIDFSKKFCKLSEIKKSLASTKKG